MGRAHSIPVPVERARRERRREVCFACDGRELVDAEGLTERHGEQQSTDAGREGVHIRPDQVLDARRQRDVVVELERAALRERPCELEGEQRVAERRFVDATEDVARQAQAEPERHELCGWPRG